MIRCLLDTNICIEIIRGRSVKVLKRLQQHAVGEVGISAITLAELEHGVEKSAKPGQNRIALSQFCAPLEILPFGDNAASVYGRIRAALERTGQVIGPMDLLIAAHALAASVTLVTNNEREFRRVKGLRRENWV
jgi:tRNA(fMet)-specific endonuclease VapC